MSYADIRAAVLQGVRPPGTQRLGDGSTIRIDYISCGRVHRLPSADTVDVFLTSQSDDALLVSTVHHRQRMDAWDELAISLTVRDEAGRPVDVIYRSPGSAGSPMIDIGEWWEIPRPPVMGTLYVDVMPSSWLDPMNQKNLHPGVPPVTYVLPNSPAWRAYLHQCAAAYLSTPERLVDDLAMAQRTNDVATAWKLIRRGVVLSSPKKASVTDLIWAILLPNRAMALELIRRGRDVNTPDAVDRGTPLMHAAGIGDVEVVRALLLHGARVDATDRFGDTALSVAIKTGNAAVVAALRAVGAR
jgi:hypothetical protein